jgi:gluconolactonase
MTMSMSTFGSGLDHPEGLAWDPAGAIVVGTESGSVLWLDPESGEVQRSIRVGDGFLAGVAMDGNGRAYVCDVAGSRVQRADPSSGAVDTYLAGTPDAPLTTPNYPVFDADGRLYVSVSGHWGKEDGRIVVVEPDGSAHTGNTEANAFTNGLALSPDGGWLYVVETTFPGISRLPVQGDGALGRRELVVHIPETVPDGLAFTADGRLVVSFYRPDAVRIWDGSGLESLVHDWTGLTLNAPTNVAFCGHDRADLFTANLGTWHLTRVDAGLTGAPLHYPKLP